MQTDIGSDITAVFHVTYLGIDRSSKAIFTTYCKIWTGGRCARPHVRFGSTGLGVARVRISHLPIDLRRRPYHILAIVLVGRVVRERLMGSVTLAGSCGQCVGM